MKGENDPQTRNSIEIRFGHSRVEIQILLRMTGEMNRWFSDSRVFGSVVAGVAVPVS